MQSSNSTPTKSNRKGSAERELPKEVDEGEKVLYEDLYEGLHEEELGKEDDVGDQHDTSLSLSSSSRSQSR